MAEILIGLKPWALNSRLESLLGGDTLRRTMLSHMLTTLELLKDGGRAGAVTDKPIGSSSMFTPFQRSQESSSTPDMYQVQATQPMALQGAYTHPSPCSFPTSTSQLSLMSSSSTLMPQFAKQNVQGRIHSQSQRLTQVLQSVKDRLSSTKTHTPNQISMISQMIGTPPPATFRPDCSSGEHLIKWRPLSSLSDRANLTQAEGSSEDMNSHIEAVMASS